MARIENNLADIVTRWPSTKMAKVFDFPEDMAAMLFWPAPIMYVLYETINSFFGMKTCLSRMLTRWPATKVPQTDLISLNTWAAGGEIYCS